MRSMRLAALLPATLVALTVAGGTAAADPASDLIAKGK
jgi:hypothetical protein